MQTCLEIEKLIQRNAKTDICRNWRFLYWGLILQPPNKRKSSKSYTDLLLDSCDVYLLLTPLQAPSS